MLRLKEIRISQGKTQESVSSFLKIARASYANIENGKRDPDTQTIVALADYFNVSIDALFGRQEKFHNSITDEERYVLHCYHLLKDENKKVIQGHVDFLLSEQDKEKVMETSVVS